LFVHATIWDSGPSGRRGFDRDQVLNLRAEGYGHSDLFSILPLILALIALLDAGMGRGLWEVREVPAIVASISAGGLALVLATILIACF